MRRFMLHFALAAGCLVAGVVAAAEEALPVVTGSGMVVKAQKGALTVQLRGAEGKFGKSVAMKLTGTSKITLLTQEKRAGKLVPVQRDVEAQDLEANQVIAVIYLPSPKEPVLLAAVAQPAK